MLAPNVMCPIEPVPKMLHRPCSAPLAHQHYVADKLLSTYLRFIFAKQNAKTGKNLNSNLNLLNEKLLILTISQR